MRSLPATTLTLRRFRIGLMIIGITLMVGTAAFHVLEGWSVFDSFYAAVLIVATLGFGRHYPATTGGEIVTMMLITAGVGTLYYLVGLIAELTIESQLGLRKERRMQQQISRLRDHVIVCGYGRVGQQVVIELQREDQPFVVVETNPTKIEQLVERDILVYLGDASEDRVLNAVGIKHARALIACSGNDAVNVFVTLSARAINEALFIAARAIREEDEPKLLRAGANRALTPASLGGRRLASLILRPTVVEWLDVMVHADDLELWLEEIPMRHLPKLNGRRIADAHLRSRFGINVLAVKRGTAMLTLLGPEFRFELNDILVALGARQGFTMLRREEGLDDD